MCLPKAANIAPPVTTPPITVAYTIVEVVSSATELATEDSESEDV